VHRGKAAGRKYRYFLGHGHRNHRFGWKNVIDLGDITTARGTEMFLALWVRLYGKMKTPAFNIRIVT
jgi:hypothetical protein